MGARWFSIFHNSVATCIFITAQIVAVIGLIGLSEFLMILVSSGGIIEFWNKMSNLPLTCRRAKDTSQPHNRLASNDLSSLRLPRLKQSEEDHLPLHWMKGDAVQDTSPAKYEWLMNNLKRKVGKEHDIKKNLVDFEGYLKKINTFMEDEIALSKSKHNNVETTDRRLAKKPRHYR